MKNILAFTVCLSALSGLLVTNQVQDAPQEQIPFSPPSLSEPDGPEVVPPDFNELLEQRRVARNSDSNDPQFDALVAEYLAADEDEREALKNKLADHWRSKNQSSVGRNSDSNDPQLDALIAEYRAADEDEREAIMYKLADHWQSKNQRRVARNSDSNDPQLDALIAEYLAADEDEREAIKDKIKDRLNDSWEKRMEYHEEKLSSMQRRVAEMEKQLAKRRANSQEVVELQLKLIITQAEMGEIPKVNSWPNEPLGRSRPSDIQRRWVEVPVPAAERSRETHEVERAMERAMEMEAKRDRLEREREMIKADHAARARVMRQLEQNLKTHRAQEKARSDQRKAQAEAEAEAERADRERDN